MCNLRHGHLSEHHKIIVKIDIIKKIAATGTNLCYVVLHRDFFLIYRQKSIQWPAYFVLPVLTPFLDYIYTLHCPQKMVTLCHTCINYDITEDYALGCTRSIATHMSLPDIKRHIFHFFLAHVFSPLDPFPVWRQGCSIHLPHFTVHLITTGYMHAYMYTTCTACI